MTETKPDALYAKDTHPSSQDEGWYEETMIARAQAYNFRRFNFKINDVVYTSRTEEFENAMAPLEIMAALSGTFYSHK